MNQPSFDLSEFAARIVQEARVPGVSISLLVDGERLSGCAGLVRMGADEPMRVDTRFQIGCLTKMLSSLAALDLAASGRLEIDRSVVDWLPEVAGKSVGAELRVRHLLAHCSGLRGISSEDERAGILASWPEVASMIRGALRVFGPGSAFNYHISDHLLLAEILRRVAGREPLEVIADATRARGGASAQRFCESLAVDHRWSADAKGYVPAPTSRYAAPWDAAVSAPPLSTDEMLDIIERIISPEDTLGENVERNFTRQIVPLPRPPRRLYDAWGGRVLVSYGLGCGKYSDGSFGVSGSTPGQCCAVHFHPAMRIAFAIAFNAPVVMLRNRTAAAMFGALDVRGEYEEAAPDRQPVDAPELPGSYVGGVEGQEIWITREPHTLRVHFSSRHNQKSWAVPFNLDERGEMLVAPRFAQLPIFLHRVAGSGDPGLMYGWHAYRKEP